ncbi:MAG: PAS domain-containing sensor histidine kinase [Candidatus Obscuribacterales bacterium]|jgi:PAS domain S-box-containing protein
MQIKLTNQGFILVLIPLAVQVAFLVAFFCMLQQAEKEIVQEQQARDMVTCLNHIARTILASSAGVTLQAPSGGTVGDGFRPSAPSDSLPREFAKLRKLASGHPEQMQAIEKLEVTWRESWHAMKEIKNYAKSGENFSVLAKVAKLQIKLQSVYRAIDACAVYFEQLQEQGPVVQEELRQQQKVALLAFLLIDVAMALGLCFYFSKQTGGRLKTLMLNARSLVVGKPIEGRLTGNDELAELQRTLMQMADSLAQARQKERAILDNAGDVICSLDANVSIVSTNNTAQKLWGFPEDDLLGRRLAELINPADWDSTRQKFAEIRKTGKAQDIECSVVTASGLALATLWNVNWSESEKNYFCVAHDITARRQLERLKLEFMSMITHDIRSPINSVQAFLSMLAEKFYGELNEKGLHRLKSLEESVNLVSRLISDLLDLEKAESGMLVLEPIDAVSTQIIASSIDVVRSLAERKQVMVTQKGVAFDLFVDQSRMIQVMVNLIANAIKFSPAASTVTVECKEIIGGREKEAIFVVTDQGPGIKPEHHARIFDRFEQIGGRGKTSAGSGLGLAIAKAIVERHKGHISVESDGEHGSKFIVRIPIGDV